MIEASVARIGAVSVFLLRLVLIAIAAAFAQPSFAQTTTNYSNSTNGAINGSTTCGAPLVRTFVVGDSFTVGDVNLGFFATHTWRGDIRLTLEAPDGTRVQLVNGDANSTSGDNLNVLLDDSAGTTVNSTNPTGAHSTANPPPFENTFSPNSALSAFSGVSSAGTWRLEICDIFPSADVGTFQLAQLQLTSLPTNTADLSLTKTVSNATPTSGSAISYTLQVTNAGPTAATGVQVLDQLPTGFDFSSASGAGSYSAATGIWTLPTIPSGQTRTLTINGVVTAPNGTTITNFAEISASDNFDADSTPGNSSLTEDDDASASFTVQGTRTAGIPPVLSCPAGTNIFDWDTRSWAAGSLNNTFNVPSFGDVNFAISSDGVFVDDPGFDGQSPTLTDANSGGLGGNQVALHQFLDFANRQQTATTVITLPNGIAGAQFILFDVDFAANDFADKVTVTGSYKGATVIPTLTNGTANYVVGNTAIGDQGSGGTSGNANVVVTFASAIDSITIVYGNADTAPVVPDGQAIAIHDLTFCAPDTEVTVTKVSSVVFDPVNLGDNPKRIPGATIEYVISVTNAGISDVDAETLLVTDIGPPEGKLCLINQAGGPITFDDPDDDSEVDLIFSGLGALGDDVEFSEDNGSTWDYEPDTINDNDGCDADVTHFRVRPTGPFAAQSEFALRVRYIILE
ncbi:MAG: proprotein convertase P-domain-containing protein [Pseudomonadota bacterium]